MVAGQDAQTTGIDWKGSVQAEFGGKIRNRLFGNLWKLTDKPAVAARRDAVELFHRNIVFTQKIRIAGRVGQALNVDFIQQPDGIVLGVFPELGVEPLEK